MGLFYIFKKRTEKRANYFSFPSCPKCNTRARPATSEAAIFNVIGSLPKTMTWKCPNCSVTFVNPLESGQIEESQMYLKEEIEKTKKEANSQKNNLTSLMEHTEKGYGYYQKGQYDLAIKEYEAALELDTKNPNSRISLGNAYKAKGDIDRAIEEYRLLLAIDPNLAQAYYNLGDVYREKGNNKEAIVSYRKFISLVRQQHVPSLIRKTEELVRQLENGMS